MNIIRYTNIIWISILISAMLIAPYGSWIISNSFFCIPLLVGVFGFALYEIKKKCTMIQRIQNLIIILGVIPSYFLITTVSFRNELVSVTLDGIITSKERGQHNYPVVKVKNTDGTVIILESVSEDFFTAVQTEDRIIKSIGFYAKVNNQRLQIKEPSLLDKYRNSNR